MVAAAQLLAGLGLSTTPTPLRGMGRKTSKTQVLPNLYPKLMHACALT